MRRAALALVMLLSACAEFPALDARMSEADRSAAYPALIPLGPLLAQADAAALAPPPDLTSRIAGLTARAAALRGAVLTPAEQARLAR